MFDQALPNREIAEILGTNNVVSLVCDAIGRDNALRLAGELTHLKVSYLSEFLHESDPIVDALNRTDGLRRLRVTTGPGILLLIDPEPHANWGHPCWIATYDVSTRKVRVVSHHFPPREEPDRRLVPFIAVYDHTRPAKAS